MNWREWLHWRLRIAAAWVRLAVAWIAWVGSSIRVRAIEFGCRALAFATMGRRGVQTFDRIYAEIRREASIRRTIGEDEDNAPAERTR